MGVADVTGLGITFEVHEMHSALRIHEHLRLNAAFRHGLHLHLSLRSVNEAEEKESDGGVFHRQA